MFRQLILLNAILLALVVAGGLRLAHDMQAFSAEHRIDRIQPDSDKPLPKAIPSAAASPKQDWPDIAAHNPFSFDRNDVAIVVTPQAAQQPKRPKPILFGTMRLGKDPLAMLATGDSTTRSSRPVYVGDVFDGWTVVDIQDKTVTVKSDDVKETLIINDPTAQVLVSRDYGKTGPAAPSPGPVTSVWASPIATTPPISAPTISSPQSAATETSGKKTCQAYTPFGMITRDCQ
jgi:hypothetical protein